MFNMQSVCFFSCAQQTRNLWRNALHAAFSEERVCGSLGKTLTDGSRNKSLYRCWRAAWDWGEGFEWGCGHSACSEQGTGAPPRLQRPRRQGRVQFKKGADCTGWHWADRPALSLALAVPSCVTSHEGTVRAMDSFDLSEKIIKLSSTNTP